MVMIARKIYVNNYLVINQREHSINSRFCIQDSRFSSLFVTLNKIELFIRLPVG